MGIATNISSTRRLALLKMFGLVALTVVGALLAVTVNLYLSFARNLAAAKKTGLRCIPARE